MKKLLRIALWTMAAFLFLVMIAPYVLAGGLRVVWTVLFGWLEFLKRVIPAVTVSWSGVAMVVICSALIVGGLHWLCAWFARQRVDPDVRPVRWRWSWSLALYGFLWLLFLAAMGITGFTHQIGWLITSKEPWQKPRKHAGIWHSELRQAGLAFSMAGQDHGWNPANTRSNFLADMLFKLPHNDSLLDELQVVMVPNSKGEIIVACLFYRDPLKRGATGMLVIKPDAAQAFESTAYETLPEIVAKGSSR